MNNQFQQDIYNYALDRAIEKHNFIMVEKCLLNGAIITNHSVSILCDVLTKPPDYVITNDWDKDIFKLLLKYGFQIIANNHDFIEMSVMHSNAYFIQNIIKAGYNGSFDNSVHIFNIVVKTRGVCPQILSILLANGFDRHIQTVLMNCIKADSYKHLPLLLSHRANFYSILTEVCAYISMLAKPSDSIKFAFEHMFKICMLDEPVLKYFLVRSVRFDIFLNIPTEICVYIFQLFMEIDYALINYALTKNLRKKGRKGKL